MALLGVSVPSFWLALMLIVLFSVILEWLPTGGYVPFADSPVDWFRSLLMPSLSLALLQIGLLARITRATMLEVLRQDYVRTARAKGLPRAMVIGKHALKNVMVPVVTVIGISFGLLLSELGDEGLQVAHAFFLPFGFFAFAGSTMAWVCCSSARKRSKSLSNSRS